MLAWHCSWTMVSILGRHCEKKTLTNESRISECAKVLMSNSLHADLHAPVRGISQFLFPKHALCLDLPCCNILLIVWIPAHSHPIYNSNHIATTCQVVQAAEVAMRQDRHWPISVLIFIEPLSIGCGGWGGGASAFLEGIPYSLEGAERQRPKYTAVI